MCKDKQIAALRFALLQMLQMPDGNSIGAIKARSDARTAAHAVYCATAPEWQQLEALALARDSLPEIATYPEAIRAMGRSILDATERP